MFKITNSDGLALATAQCILGLNDLVYWGPILYFNCTPHVVSEATAQLEDLAKVRLNTANIYVYLYTCAQLLGGRINHTYPILMLKYSNKTQWKLYSLLLATGLAAYPGCGGIYMYNKGNGFLRGLKKIVNFVKNSYNQVCVWFCNYPKRLTGKDVPINNHERLNIQGYLFNMFWNMGRTQFLVVSCKYWVVLLISTRVSGYSRVLLLLCSFDIVNIFHRNVLTYPVLWKYLWNSMLWLLMSATGCLPTLFIQQLLSKI